MNHEPDADPLHSTRSPLIPIGLTLLAVLLVPIILYSVGPDGPGKVGDVVFATDRHRVKFVDSAISSARGYQDFWLLESRVQLVVQRIERGAGHIFIAEPIGQQKNDVPFCPSRMPLLLHPHQGILKADIWGGLRDTLSHFMPRP